MRNKIRDLLFISLICIFALSSQSAFAAEGEEALQLGCVAYAKEASANAYRQIGEYLEKELGRQVTVTVYPNYHEVIHDIANDKLDVAVLSPVVFLCADQAVDLSILGHGVYGASGDFAYRSTIFVPAGSDLNSLDDLAGKKVAFVDQLSASGFIVPKVAMMKAGLKDVASEFAGNHVDAFRKLVSGEVEAAATLDTIMQDEPALAEHSEDVKVLWTSEFVIPSDVFVTTPKVSASVNESITTALLKYSEAQEGGRTSRNAIFSGFVPEDENLYKGLKSLVAEFSN